MLQQKNLPIITIIIMEICKVPTLRLKALNKHSITRIMYIKMEMLSAIKNINTYTEKLTHKVDKILLFL